MSDLSLNVAQFDDRRSYPVAATGEVLADFDGADLFGPKFAIGRAIQTVSGSERRLLGGGPMSAVGATRPWFAGLGSVGCPSAWLDDEPLDVNAAGHDVADGPGPAHARHQHITKVAI
jgi:hypothetical protein